MKRLPSTSSIYAPDARRMKSGEAPTDLNARTGLSTPPGRMLSARVKRREDRVVFMREAFSRASMARAGEAVAANDDAGPLAGMTHVVENDLAVHDDRRDADRILERIGERRAVGDRGRIEDDEIGGESFLDRAAVGDVELLRGQAAHLVDGLFERDDALLADVLAEDARKRAEIARMRHADPQRTADRERRSVRSNRYPRLLERELQIGFVDDEPDAAHAAAAGNQHLEHEVVRILSHLLGGIVDAPPFEPFIAGIHSGAPRVNRAV